MLIHFYSFKFYGTTPKIKTCKNVSKSLNMIKKIHIEPLCFNFFKRDIFERKKNTLEVFFFTF